MTNDSHPTPEAGSSSLADALFRLNKALDVLDEAVELSLENRNTTLSADEEVQRMADDRAKLASELDGVKAHAARLKETNSEVSRRIVGAMEMVRGVLDQSR